MNTLREHAEVLSQLRELVPPSQHSVADSLIDQMMAAVGNDSLSGLPNALALSDLIETIGGQLDWVYFAGDLNEFKLLNEQYGHLGADEVIASVGRWLLKLCDSVEGCQAFRPHGDEFVVIVTKQRAHDVVTYLQTPLPEVVFDGQVIQYEVSFGWADWDSTNSVERAETACGHAKRESRRVEAWIEGMTREESTRWRCENAKCRATTSASALTLPQDLKCSCCGTLKDGGRVA